jgi:hypothetical protein
MRPDDRIGMRRTATSFQVWQGCFHERPLDALCCIQKRLSIRESRRPSDHDGWCLMAGGSQPKLFRSGTMADREQLKDWVYQAVLINQGKTKLVNVARHIWGQHEQ